MWLKRPHAAPRRKAQWPPSRPRQQGWGGLGYQDKSMKNYKTSLINSPSYDIYDLDFIILVFATEVN
jgi:hypothetical protein